MIDRVQPDEETRRIAYRNAPAWAIEAGWDNPDANDEDETTECEVEGCGQSFPDKWAWQEHWEDTHLGTDDDPDQ